MVRKEGKEGGRAYLGDERAVPAVNHEDIGALPLGHLNGGGRGAHLGRVGVVQLLGDESAAGKRKEGGRERRGGREGEKVDFGFALTSILYLPLPQLIPLFNLPIDGDAKQGLLVAVALGLEQLPRDLD